MVSFGLRVINPAYESPKLRRTLFRFIVVRMLGIEERGKVSICVYARILVVE